MHRTTTMLLLLAACSPIKTHTDPLIIGPDDGPVDPVVDPPSESGDTGSSGDTGATWALRVVEGPALDNGFGSTLAIDGDSIWAGAPHGPEGVVYRIDGDSADPILSGGGRLGSALAVGDSGLLIGAPLTEDGAGAVVDSSGIVVVAGTGSTGLALAGGPAPAIANGAGWTRLDGDSSATLARPSSIAIAGDRVGVGMARGDVAFQVGEQTMDRPAPADFAGFSVAAADLDGDGTLEWIVGAPGSSTVRILDGETLDVRHTLTGAGDGFGAAVATCDRNGDGQHALLVGAPSAARSAGEVVLYTDPMSDTPTTTWTGDTPGRQLGFSVACGPVGWVMGGPGGGLLSGQVWIVD
jgi:hypothetical protein